MLTRRTMLVGALGLGATGVAGIVTVRGRAPRPDAPDAGALGEGPWRRVTLRVEGMT